METAKSVQFAFSPVRHNLGEPKVRDLNVPIPVDQKILWFQIAVHDIVVVQMLERERDLARVKLGRFLWEPAWGPNGGK